MRRWARVRRGIEVGLLLLCVLEVGDPVRGIDNRPHPLPLLQDWSVTTLITTPDDWSGVRGIEGYLGQNITTATGVDPQTLLTTSNLANDLDVIANQSNPNGLSAGGVAEFDGIPNPTIALQGSGTADAPYLLLHVDTRGRSNISLSYTLRDLDGSADNAIQPVALHYRIGDSGLFTNLPEGFVADATTGPGEATLETPVRVLLPTVVENRPLVQLRIMTCNAVGNDEWVGIDDLVVTSEGIEPTLSLGDVSGLEGNSGVRELLFPVRLSAPAGPAGVTFEISTVDETATVLDQDYLARTLSGQSIPAGATSYTFGVMVVGDDKVEPDETFRIRVSKVTGAEVIRGEAIGTILNDDLSIVPIHTLQGPGARSPFEGAVVRTRGIVTGRKSNGFFLQEPDAAVDADPATSEAIFVFTSSSPPAQVAVGNQVEVEGSVTEFVPTSDPLQPPMTQLTNVTVSPLFTTGHPLPTPVGLTATFPDPAGTHDQLERLEGMRVLIDSLTVVSPTQGFIQETNAAATSNGIFYGVVRGVARPFREPGIQAPDPPPGGTIPPIPRFDANPERIRINSLGLPGRSALNVATGTLVTGLVGPLEYSSRCYTLLPDPGANLTTTGGLMPRPVSQPQGDEWTVATFNLQRFYDPEDDPAITEPLLTEAAWQRRLAKASLAIRQYLRSPDILGVVEVENQSALDAIAERISEDARLAGEPDPGYRSWLVEGQDVGGIDVGFLVRTAAVPREGSDSLPPPRVEVEEVVQELRASQLISPAGSREPLHDRPPLRLTATVHFADGRDFRLTVLVNHLRSLSGGTSLAAGAAGWATVGDRVRAKRQRQAEDLARWVQARQVTAPEEPIILVGDFNAFEFNDGLTASLATIAGIPFLDEETAVPGDGVDLVTPDLLNLMGEQGGLPISERYTYLFDGNAQSLDHILVNRALLLSVGDHRLEPARLNADFPEVARNQSTTPTRLSDHDPLVAFFRLPSSCPTGPLVLPRYLQPQPIGEGGSVTMVPSPATSSEASGLNYRILDRGSFTGGVTIDAQGRAMVQEAAPVGTHTITLQISDRCGQRGEVRLTLVVQPVTELAGPGIPWSISGAAAAQRPGSLLLFHLYTSATHRRGIDSRISLTNSHPTQAIFLRLFFVEGLTGGATEQRGALTANQTLRFLASDLDPNVTGYLLVMATDAEGSPVAFNHLLGEVSLRTESGHTASLAAFGVPALAPEGQRTVVPVAGRATLPFDGLVYSPLPHTLAVSSLASPEDANQSLLVVNRLGGDLTRSISPLGILEGWLYDDVETSWRFTSDQQTPQIVFLLGSQTLPRLSPPYERILSRGRSGWMRLFPRQAGIALSGLLLQRNDRPEGMTQGRHLHVLTTTEEARLTVPLL
jgi:predicted extracellular nuclease